MSGEPRLREIADLAALKTLSHPRRYQIFQQLTLLGSATSAMLARELDLNTGATSYHLRELARYGFIEEIPKDTQVHGRERWWRARPVDLRFPERSQQSAEIRPVIDEMNRRAYAADIELFEQLQRQSDDLAEWADAFLYSRGSMQLTLDELRSFFEEYIALINRFKRTGDEIPAGARTVLTRFFALPAPAPEQTVTETTETVVRPGATFKPASERNESP
ncbi:helix-turn-helix transcriptional regulator [Streptomyces sp. NBC_01500]|uniref:ArsR/SmtB family transcription factor n=1 Tax=unclassified Streptomyces TaxID=2593676 RepID=UPI002258E7B5|nr:helix-turn-helix domain-containing protein [Streptomyces sp. NBC_01500]MCX4554300.1 helix-turn-helix domain-containing protein [Streptomyces sp. NBC_01500]